MVKCQNCICTKLFNQKILTFLKDSQKIYITKIITNKCNVLGYERSLILLTYVQVYILQ